MGDKNIVSIGGVRTLTTFKWFLASVPPNVIQHVKLQVRVIVTEDAGISVAFIYPTHAQTEFRVLQ